MWRETWLVGGGRRAKEGCESGFEGWVIAPDLDKAIAVAGVAGFPEGEARNTIASAS